jgi:hypothetical protein
MRPVLLALLAGASGCLGVIGSSGRDPATDPQAITTPPIVRLTRSAYLNSVRDLFPALTLPALTVPADSVVADFDNNALAQAPTAELVRSYDENAQLVGGAVLAQLEKVTACATVDEPCARTYLLELAGRAFRRPLEDEEKTRIADGLKTRAGEHGLREAVSLMVQAILQAPAFLYRIEAGVPVAGRPEVAQLQPHELATRLSYFLWNTMPDAALRAAADDGSLIEPAVLEAQARRLLADAKARTAVAHMQEQWLRFDKMNGLRKNAGMFPEFDDALLGSMRESTARFVDHAFWDEGTLEALLTDTHTFVNQPLAAVYGMSGISGNDLQLTSADAKQRSGVLTQVGLLAAFGHETRESPVLRGVFVLDRILCAPPPPPPPNVNNSPPEIMPGAPPATTRELFSQQHEQGACAGCHKVIDGVGFGFEHYDTMGRWRDFEAGKPVDASGEINGTQEIDGPFDGAVELGRRLANSRTVQTCVTRKWLQYALNLDPSMLTEDVVVPLRGEATGGFNMRELLVRLVKSSTFRYRTVQP